jgi:superfamily II DNA or RNA helicase
LSEFSEAQAISLGLPANTPFELRLDLTGPIHKGKTNVRVGWFTRGAKKVVGQETGCIYKSGYDYYRISAPVYQLIQAVDNFNEWDGHSLDDRLLRLSELQKAISDITGEQAPDLDKQLSAMKLLHASSASLDIRMTKEGVEFDPVLFSRERVEQSRLAGTLVEEADQLIPESLRGEFNHQFKSGSDVKPTYVVARNQYLFIDPSLRETLKVIKQVQSSDASTRARFAKSPQSYIKEVLLESVADDEVANDIVDTVFVETDKFSERVLQLGLWSPPVLPFVKRAENSWFPEEFGLKIGTDIYRIELDDIEDVINKVQEAINRGVPEVEIEPGVMLQATKEVVVELKRLHGMVKQSPPPTDSTDSTDSSPTSEKSILHVQTNFEGDNFSVSFKLRDQFSGLQKIQGLKNQLKSHQEEGLAWLQQAWCEGYPGVLLADDMGLGKTFQTLAFISWLKAKRESLGLNTRPVLVVAPTSLLGNWQAEAQLHLDEGAVGSMCLLYGNHLKQCKKEGVKGNDVTLGEQTLTHSRISHADWVLTTYETMRDYHISLASISFSCIIFDEMQKVKSPQSMMTHAAQALNADFKIGLTGTPIENSLADIWTLFDTLAPGVLGLGDLKSFLKEYTLENPAKLKELKVRLTENIADKPSVMMRRLKSDVAKDLPRKLEIQHPQEMPELQAEEYLKALESAISEAKGAKLQAIHRMRSVSLHPFEPDSSQAGDADSYISNSARLEVCFKLLDEIHSKKEKALLFIESISMHEWLAYAIKERYKLAELPERIFGSVSSVKRTQIVDDFQSEKNRGEFEVLLLSPKAAGVGLTLTAATHVIHLSRWWNPAVEDQCTDRAYRIGQTKDVHVHIPLAIHPFYADSSFDCILNDLLTSKRELSREMLMPSETGNEVNDILGKVGQVPKHSGQSDRTP